MYWLTAPYLTWPQQESIYQVNDNRNKAVVRRLAHHKDIWENKQCTEFEAMIYISTSTFEHPPSHHLANVYFWLFRREMPDQAEAALGDFSGTRDLDPTEKDMLADVRRWIFKQQLHHMKAKRLGETPAVKREQKVLEEQQAKLF